MGLKNIKFIYALELLKDPDFPHSFWPDDPHWWDSPRLTDILREWCRDNSGIEGIAWQHENTFFTFAKDEDAFAFRLRWC